MPEGDTIAKVASYLAGRLEGQRVLAATAIRHPEVQLKGHRVQSVHAIGKHLFIDVDSGHTLRTHLGMHGSWHRYDVTEPWKKPKHRASVSLQVGSDIYVCFNAKEVEWMRTASIQRQIIDARLGPNLAQSNFDVDRIVLRAREFLDPDAPMVDVLLDQRVAAGIGNVYKSELLFSFGLAPTLELQRVPDGTLRDVFVKAGQLLQRNLGGGPRVTRFTPAGSGRLWVYRRAGLPCFECESEIKMEKLGRTRRSTYSCPSCQI